MTKLKRTFEILSTAILLAAVMPLSVKAQEVSIRTNLAWDAVSEPNIGLEFQLSDHWSLGANAGIKAWPRWLAWDWDQENTTHWRNFAVVPEVRYYLKDVYDGFFAGADFIYTHFNVGNVQTPFHMYPEVEQYRDQGSFWGGGLFAGYAWWPFQHWRFEVEAGAALGLAAYQRFDCANCGSKLADESKPAVVPKIGLNVAYNPVSRDKHKAKKAASVISGTDTLTVLSAPVALVIHLNDVTAPETEGDKLAKSTSWVIPIEKFRPFDYLTRPGQDSLQYVTFPVNSNKLDRDMGSNGATLDRIQKAIETIRDEERTDEILVSIVGLASIEGPQELNDTLAASRARAVANYLNQKTFVSQRNFEAIGKGEAWDWFKDQLEAIPDGGEGLTASEVKTLLDIVYDVKDADERERKIKAMPELYKKVADNLLQDQRNSGYIRVYYGNAPHPATEKLNGIINGPLKEKRYKEAVNAIQADKGVMAMVESNAEAANAYGIALYFTALDNKDEKAEEEAIKILEKAAADGSVAAKENLKGIEIYGPARKEFEAWQQLMNENN